MSQQTRSLQERVQDIRRFEDKNSKDGNIKIEKVAERNEIQKIRSLLKK